MAIQPNASLNNNLQQTFSGVQDPFGQARFQSQQQPPANVMDNPFGGMGQQTAMQPGQPQGPTMASMQPPQTPSFPDLAQQLGIDANGLHKNSQLAKLQLTQRMQQLHGAAYLQTPMAQQLFSSFDNHVKGQEQPSQREDSTQTAQAERTLKALMGQPS